MTCSDWIAGSVPGRAVSLPGPRWMLARPAGSASGPAGSACGRAKAARPAWFQLAAELPARPPGPRARHPRQGHGRLTARLCRDRASYAADVGRRREHRPDARTARTRHRPRPPLVPAARSRDRVRVECDAGPQYLTIAGYRPPWRPGADSEWTRFPVTRLRYTRPPGPSRFTGGTVTCASTSMTSSSHHRTSATCCARSTATRSRSSGDSPSRLRRPAQCRYLTVPLPAGPARHPAPQGYEQFRDLTDCARSSPETRRPRPCRSGSG